MKNLLITIMLAICTASALHGQNTTVQQTTTLQNAALQTASTDTTLFERPHLADSTLVGTTVFQLLTKEGDGTLKLNQPQEMEQAYNLYLKANGERKRNGYRIRLFFDNKQSARTESEELEKSFQLQFPQIPTYRSYTNPFFKLVVGDYRTKSDAIKALNKILPFYPKAIVVKESIYYPEI